MNGLAVVAIRMLHRIQIEHAELRILDLDHRRIHIVGQILVAHAVVHRAVGVFKEDARGIVHCQHRAAIRALRGLLRAAVEDHQIRLVQPVGHERAHVLHINVERRRIHQADNLRKAPAFGLRGGVEVLEHPRAVEFNEHALGAVRFVQLDEARHVLHLLQIHLDRVRLAEQLRIVFLLALLAANQKRALALGKAVVGEHFGHKLGLSALQKAGNNVNRYVSSAHAITPLSVRRRSAKRRRPIPFRCRTARGERPR